MIVTGQKIKYTVHAISPALYSLKIIIYIDLDGLWSCRFVLNIRKFRQLLDNLVVTKNRAPYCWVIYPCNQIRWVETEEEHVKFKCWHLFSTLRLCIFPAKYILMHVKGKEHISSDDVTSNPKMELHSARLTMQLHKWHQVLIDDGHLPWPGGTWTRHVGILEE